jgi:thiol-disulfide isomerase/thioredoxin
MSAPCFRPSVLAALLMLCLPVFATSLHEQMQALNIDVPRERLPAPLFELTALDGDSARLQDYRGRLVLLHFWATFCAPCRKEMPALETLAQQFAGKDLVVLAIAVDRSGRRVVENFVQQYDLHLRVPLDPDGTVRKQYAIDALPTSYLIGRDGRFVGRSIGERDWSNPAFAALLEQLIGP